MELQQDSIITEVLNRKELFSESHKAPDLSRLQVLFQHNLTEHHHRGSAPNVIKEEKLVDCKRTVHRGCMDAVSIR